MTKKELGQRIKIKYPEYNNLDDEILADKIIAKYPVYGDQITQDKGAVSKMVSGIKSKITGRVEDVKEAVTGITPQKLATPAGQARIGLRVAGAGAGAINDIILEGIKAIVPDKFEEKVKTGIQSVAETDTGRYIATNLMNWAEKNPEAAKDLENALDISAFLPSMKAAQVGARAATTAAKTTAREAGAIAGKGLQVAGTIGEKGGKSLVSAALPPTEQAGRVLAYKAKTPLISRFKQAMVGAEKAPVTPADVAIKYDLATLSRSGIGIKAKRTANQLFENQVKPVLNGIKDKVSVKKWIDSAYKEVNTLADETIKKEYKNALDSISKDYGKLTTISVKRLDEIKSSLASRVPSKAYRGQDISGSINNVRKILADKARIIVREKLPENVKSIYDDYGSLLSLTKMGEKALKSGINTNMIGLAGEGMRMLTTPIATLSGTAVSKIGTAARKLGTKLLPKGKGEILKTTSLKSAKKQLDPLIQEAKKYKSADEFIKAQGTFVYRGGDTALDTSRGSGRGISVSDKETAGLFIPPKGGVVDEAILPKTAKILKESDIPKNLQDAYIKKAKVLADPNNFSKKLQQSVIDKQQAIIDYARKNDFDAVEFPFEKEIRVIKPDVLKTKSQLIDIWKKANKK